MQFPYEVSGPDADWGYGLVVPLKITAEDALWVDAECLEGSIGFGCNNAALSRWNSNRVPLTPEDGRQRFVIVLNDGEKDAALVANNFGVPGSKGRIYSVEMVKTRDLSRRDRYRAKLTKHNYWHYDFDFGDGLSVKATIPTQQRMQDINRAVLDRLIDEVAPQARSVLDIGCSSGFHTLQLARRGTRAKGVDFDPVQIEQAQIVLELLGQGLDLAFAVDDVATMSPEPYDLVHCSGLLYHLKDVYGACRKIFECAGQGAVVHTHVDGFEGLNLRLHDHQSIPGNVYNGPYEFVLVPTMEVLARCFREVGFSGVKTYRAMDLIPESEMVGLSAAYDDLLRRHTAYFALTKAVS